MNNIADELHKNNKNVKNFRKVITHHKNNIWSADLVFMNQYPNENNGYNYILTIIDVHTKYAWAIPLHNKESKNVSIEFEKLFKKYGRPEHLWTDQGTEFYSSIMKKLLDKYNVNIYSTFGNAKASVIERFNRTFKNIMYK